MRRLGRRASEAAEYFLDCCARSYFSLTLATDAVCQGKQPAVGTGLGGRTGQHIAQIVFVARTNAARIRELRKLNVQHKYAHHGEQFVTASSPNRTALACRFLLLAMQKKPQPASLAEEGHARLPFGYRNL